MNRLPPEQQAMALREVLEKEEPFSEADLDVLRHNTAATALLSGKSDYFVFRIQIELIHSILKLDKSSSRLAKVGLWLSLVGLVLAAVQVFEAMRH